MVKFSNGRGNNHYRLSAYVTWKNVGRQISVHGKCNLFINPLEYAHFRMYDNMGYGFLCFVLDAKKAICKVFRGHEIIGFFLSHNIAILYRRKYV